MLNGLPKPIKVGLSREFNHAFMSVNLVRFVKFEILSCHVIKLKPKFWTHLGAKLINFVCFDKLIFIRYDT